MITLPQAEKMVIAWLDPGTEIKSSISYGDEWLFIAVRPDVLEGRFDPFVKVNKKTGDIIDFAPQDYENPLDVLKQLADNARKDQP